jgi:hypothetical protein
MFLFILDAAVLSIQERFYQMHGHAHTSKLLDTGNMYVCINNEFSTEDLMKHHQYLQLALSTYNAADTDRVEMCDKII